jgi:hypothetical protein
MKVLALFLSTIFLFSCASNQLIKDSEYDSSRALYKQSEFNKAIEKFPTKENAGFITSIEKSWLSLWTKKPDNSQLEMQVKSLDRRQYTSISQETEYFFFNETEDGYIPSEHEVVALHLINSMIYMQQNKWSDAEVEARRASYFLQNIFNPDQPHFDDPALRLWLASIWMSLGNWDAAQVDLRRINEMKPSESVKKLLALSHPPAHFRLYFNGSGPELKWTESSETPEFILNVSDEKIFSAAPWYERHLKRNTVIRDSVLKSNYMAQYLGVKTSSNTQRLMGLSFGNASRVLGVTLGGAIIVGGLYVAAQSGAASTGDSLAYIFLAGVAVGKYLWEAGDQIIASSYQGASEYENIQFEKLRTYRFVRFLPNQLEFETSSVAKQIQYNKILLFRDLTATQVEYILNP